MKLSDTQAKIILELAEGPRSYVPNMQGDLEGLEKEALIHIVFHPSPLVQPIWGLTRKGKLAVIIARFFMSILSDAKSKGEM